MTKIEETVIVNRPVEEVWRFFNDPSNLARANADPVEVKQLSPGQWGLGTTFEENWPSRHITNVERITEYKPNKEYSYEYVSGPFKGTRTTVRMEPTEGKTKLNMTYDLKLSGALKLGGPLAAQSLRKQITTSLTNTKRIIESEPIPTV